MNYRWIYAVLWFALLAGFVYVRNHMPMRGTRPSRPAETETAPRLWPVPPLVMLPSDTMQVEYAAAHFSGSAYKAWMSYNDTLTHVGKFDAGSAPLSRATHATADSLGNAAHTALDRLQIRLPQTSAQLVEFRVATARMDSLVGRAKQEPTALTELHNQTFELLRQLTALK